MLSTTFHQLIKDERGATAVEYGLLAGLIALTVIGAVTLLGTDLQTLFNHGGATNVFNAASKP